MTIHLQIIKNDLQASVKFKNIVCSITITHLFRNVKHFFYFLEYTHICMIQCTRKQNNEKGTI